MHHQKARLHVQHHLAEIGFPFRPQSGIDQPAAGKVTAGTWTLLIDAAARAADKVGTPFVLGLAELRNHQDLAAQRAVTALPIHAWLPSPAARFGSRRSPLKSVHWTDLSAFGGRGSPLQH